MLVLHVKLWPFLFSIANEKRISFAWHFHGNLIWTFNLTIGGIITLHSNSLKMTIWHVRKGRCANHITIFREFHPNSLKMTTWHVRGGRCANHITIFREFQQDSVENHDSCKENIVNDAQFTTRAPKGFTQGYTVNTMLYSLVFQWNKASIRVKKIKIKITLEIISRCESAIWLPLCNFCFLHMTDSMWGHNHYGHSV